MKNKIAANTITATFASVLTKVITGPFDTDNDTIVINYTGDTDIILKIGTNSNTSRDTDSTNDIIIPALIGQMALVGNVVSIKVMYDASAPTTGNLWISSYRSGL
jgi:hypothetical protein